MAVRIRTFLNTDLPGLCSIWNAHHRDAQNAAPINPEQFELLVQAKPYFDSSQLLLAEDDGQLLGFAQLCPVPDITLAQPQVSPIGIAALCLLPHENENQVAAQLIQAAVEYCQREGATSCLFKPALPFCGFFLGIGPADSLAGVLSSESKLCRWLASAEFKPAIPTTVWDLDLLSFKVPADRVQMLVRRRSFVERPTQEPELPWWQSCVLGHAEVTAFHLTDRIAKRTLQEVVMWSVGPLLRPSPDTVMWLWPPKMELSPQEASVEIAPADRLLFLLGESLRVLQSEQIDTVRIVTHAEANELHRVLHRLGFRAVESGVVFERRLSHTSTDS